MQEKTFILLSELTGIIQNVFKEKFSKKYWVLGEVSSHTFKEKSFWHFFDFIEKPVGKQEPVAKISAVAWKTGAMRIKEFENVTGQKFSNGLQVLLCVSVEFQALYGIKLTVEDIDADYTLGSLEKQRRETLEKLSSNFPDIIQFDGQQFITRNKKNNFPIVIQRLALIASLNSDGFHDFQHTLLNNQFDFTFSIDIYPSTVQGTEAEKSILNNLISIYNSKISYDAVVLIRGGGAKTDFLVFDSFKLALAVAKFPIPIITGIGHHKDESIVDLMAKCSTKTPTKAAELIVSHNRQFEEAILSIQNSMVIQVQKRLSSLRKSMNSLQFSLMNSTKNYSHYKKEQLSLINRKISNCSRKVIYNHSRLLMNEAIKITRLPLSKLNQENIRLNKLDNSFQSATQNYITNQKNYLKNFQSIIKIASPENTLNRGFAIVSMNDKVIANGNDILPDAQITIQMKGNKILTKVLKNKKENNYEN